MPVLTKEIHKWEASNAISMPKQISYGIRSSGIQLFFVHYEDLVVVEPFDVVVYDEERVR